MAQPMSIPTLTVLPPSSDAESWSHSPSPRPSRSSRHGRFHRSRTRTRKQNERDAQICTLEQQQATKPQIVVEDPADKGVPRRQSPSTRPCVTSQMEVEELGRDSPSQDLLLPPSHSWSRSPSPSRRSRWSLRSLLSRDSDWDSCRLVSWIYPPKNIPRFKGRNYEVKCYCAAFSHIVISSGSVYSARFCASFP